MKKYDKKYYFWVIVVNCVFCEVDMVGLTFYKKNVTFRQYCLRRKDN